MTKYTFSALTAFLFMTAGLALLQGLGVLTEQQCLPETSTAEAVLGCLTLGACIGLAHALADEAYPNLFRKR